MLESLAEKLLPQLAKKYADAGVKAMVITLDDKGMPKFEDYKEEIVVLTRIQFETMKEMITTKIH
jgi:hypothetical protein